jgi:hypothetical protein
MRDSWVKHPYVWTAAVTPPTYIVAILVLNLFVPLVPSLAWAGVVTFVLVFGYLVISGGLRGARPEEDRRPAMIETGAAPAPERRRVKDPVARPSAGACSCP